MIQDLETNVRDSEPFDKRFFRVTSQLSNVHAREYLTILESEVMAAPAAVAQFSGVFNDQQYTAIRDRLTAFDTYFRDSEAHGRTPSSAELAAAFAVVFDEDVRTPALRKQANDLLARIMQNGWAERSDNVEEARSSSEAPPPYIHGTRGGPDVAGVPPFASSWVIGIIVVGVFLFVGDLLAKRE